MNKFSIKSFLILSIILGFLNLAVSENLTHITGNEIVFPLKIKPLNDKGMEYDWTLMLGDTGESQAIFNWNRPGGRKHAARDLYTDRVSTTNDNEKAFTPNVEIVSIADGEVIKTSEF